jgi:hypothetical protein
VLQGGRIARRDGLAVFSKCGEISQNKLATSSREILIRTNAAERHGFV